MKLLNFIATSLLVLLFLSCEKAETAPEAPITTYTQTEPGHYWVYEWVEVTPSGAETKLDIIDSLFIESDIVIGGKSYFRESGTHLGRERQTIFFDSVKSLFTYPEKIMLFTTDHNQQHTVTGGPSTDPHFTIHYALKEGMFSIDVPAGTFNCLNFAGQFELLNNSSNGPRETSRFYAKDVGLVKEVTFFASSPNNIEKRLLRYGKN